MSWNKKFTQAVLLFVCTLTLTGGALVWEDTKAEEPSVLTEVSINGKAGIIASLEETENSALDLAQMRTASIERARTELVTVAPKQEAQAAGGETEETAVEGADIENTKQGETETEDKESVENKEDEKEAPETSEAAGEKPLTKTEKKWQNKVMADVDDSLSIRAKGNADAKIVGKLYPTSVATVVKEGDGWTKIESGSVKGYVKSKYLLYGQDAYENAQKVCKKYAHVKTDGLRVRNKADEDAKVLMVADKGDKLLYNVKAQKIDDWVAVKVKAGKGYVAADFVEVKLGTTKAVSIEEINAQKATLKSEGTPRVPESDMTLLAAIIQCEAGSESYTGKVAVGAVVMNRVRSSRFPNTISGVIYQRGQFSPVGNGALARVLASGNISSACRQAAADALAGADPTGGKLFFHRVNGRSGLIIGNHVFY